MKKVVLTFGFLVLSIGNVFAAEFSDFLTVIRNKSGVVYHQKGNSIFGSDGHAFQIKGKSIFGNDGTAYQIKDDMILTNYGIVYKLDGETLWGSNGKVYKKRGDRIFSSDGVHCFFEVNLKKREKMTFCK